MAPLLQEATQFVGDAIQFLVEGQILACDHLFAGTLYGTREHTFGKDNGRARLRKHVER